MKWGHPGRCPGLVCAAPLVLRTAAVAEGGACRETPGALALKASPAITQPPQVCLDGNAGLGPATLTQPLPRGEEFRDEALHLFFPSIHAVVFSG